MKRLTYVSGFARDLSAEEVEQIEAVSVRNNRRDGLTGALFCFKNIFYQTIEGDEDKIDQCYSRILADDRHVDIFCLKIETDVKERLYPDWDMRTVQLDVEGTDLFLPLRNMLDSLVTTHKHLQRYTPPRVLQAIQGGVSPDTLVPKRVEKVVMFCDMMASTTFFEKLGPESSRLLDQFYSISNRAIGDHGGMISKLTGDGVMAYWDIGRADRALNASRQIITELDRLRKKSGDQPEGFLFAGIGLSAGSVIEGNIGDSRFKDYTLLGDAVNTAARMEGVTRKVGHAVVFDESVASRLPESITARRLGIYQPKGKTDRLPIFTIDDGPTELPYDPAELKMKIISNASIA